MKKIALNVAGFFVAIVAVLFNLPTLYLMAAILWLMPLISYAMGWLMLRGLVCERHQTEACQVGERVRMTLTLSNQGRLPKFFLLVRETLPRGVHAVESSAPLLLQLAPKESSDITITVEVEKRGVFRIGPVQVFSSDPMGLQTFAQKLPGVSELIVYPAVVPLDTSWLTGSAAQGWRGQENATVRGGGTDFYGVRDFQPGDELRRVHWRTTARTGSLAVTEYTQGLALDALIVLDLNASAYKGTGDGPQSAFEIAVTLAASLLHELMKQGHSAQLLMADSVGMDGIFEMDQLPRYLETLARAQANSQMELPDVLAKEGVRAGRETTLVYITPNIQNPRLSDILAEWQSYGVQTFGLALDADSFRAAAVRSERSGQATLNQSILNMSQSSSTLKIVRYGDDLHEVIQGGGYGSN